MDFRHTINMFLSLNILKKAIIYINVDNTNEATRSNILAPFVDNIPCDTHLLNNVEIQRVLTEHFTSPNTISEPGTDTFGERFFY